MYFNYITSIKKLPALIFLLIFINSAYSQINVASNECDNWQTNHPEWIFCDDFESGQALVKDGRYFEADTSAGKFEFTNDGINGSSGMRAIWQTGDVGVGNLKLGFGRTPVAYMDKGIRSSEDFREVYYRMFLKMENAWQGNPEKLSRATVFAKSNWGQAMAANTWQGSNNELGIDPTSCVKTQSSNDVVTCEGYNDFSERYFLGYKSGTTPIFDTNLVGQWQCIEVHVKLNDAGASNGAHEVWVNDSLEISSTNLDFVKSYNDYAINAIFFENYWNAGSPKIQERYFDNIVVSTEKIGCTSTGSITNSSSNDDSGTGSIGFYTLSFFFVFFARKINIFIHSSKSI